MSIYNIIFVIIKMEMIFICFYIYIYYNSKIKYSTNKATLLIAIFSCNRYNYLNKTLTAFFNHLLVYENKLNYNIMYVDQGTLQRYLVSVKFKLLNTIYMNPIGYSSSFNIVFSYLYTKYILFLEEDWEVVKHIEKYIFYPSFITESIKILDIVEVVYGILLRNIADIYVNCSLNVVTNMGKHLLYVLKPQKNRFTYTNGASIYRTSNLKHIKEYKNEYSVSQYFKINNYKMGFTYKGIKGCNNCTNTQYVMKHIGKNSSRKGRCNIWLY